MFFKVNGGVTTPFFQDNRFQQTVEEKEYEPTSYEKGMAKIREKNPFCNVCRGNKQSHDAQVRDGDVRPHAYLEEGGYYMDIDGNKVEVPPVKN